MKNIDIASVQKRRFETYEKEKDNLIVVRVDGGYTVSNLNKASYYSVTKGSSGNINCTCKDFTNYAGLIRCKHIISVLKKADRKSKTSIKTEDNNLNMKKEEINMNSNQNNPINNNINNMSAEENTVDIQTILSRQFPQEIIRYREGQKKKQLAYVETAHYIDRLNEAFNFQWNWEILSEHITDTEVYCRGKLTVVIDGKTVIKEAYGGKDLTIVDVWEKQTRQITGKKPFSIADDLKSASSDALKKACSLLGIGSHLYKSAQGNISATDPKQPITAPKQTAGPAATVKPVNATVAITAPTTPTASANRPSAPPAKPPASPTTSQPAGSLQGKGGNGKGNGKHGGNGSGDINRIIERW